MIRNGLLSIFLVSLWALPLQSAEVSFSREGDTVAIREGDRLLTVLHTDGQKCPYFHPVLTRDGRALTRQWPLAESSSPESKDHPHHVGLHYAHGAVRIVKDGKPGEAVDFWHNNKGVIRNRELRIDGEQGALILKNQWLDEAGELMLRDVTRVAFGGDEGARWIDWKVTLTAPESHGLIFGDTKEGTFSIRLAEELAIRSPDKDVPTGVARGNLANSRGANGKDVWGKRAEWCAAYGDLEGKPVVVALLDHPDNPRHPTWWMARDYGMFNINPFGISFFANKDRGTGDFSFQAGESVTFRYRVLLMESAFDAEVIEEQYRGFIRSVRPAEAP